MWRLERFVVRMKVASSEEFVRNGETCGTFTPAAGRRESAVGLPGERAIYGCFDHGGTTPIMRAYATDWPMCS
jgi:hypothetical protein